MFASVVAPFLSLFCIFVCICVCDPFGWTSKFVFYLLCFVLFFCCCYFYSHLICAVSYGCFGLESLLIPLNVCVADSGISFVEYEWIDSNDSKVLSNTQKKSMNRSIEYVIWFDALQCNEQREKISKWIIIDRKRIIIVVVGSIFTGNATFLFTHCRMKESDAQREFRK